QAVQHDDGGHRVFAGGAFQAFEVGGGAHGGILTAGAATVAAMIDLLPPALRTRLAALLAPGERRLLGLVGAPGAGKSTLAQALADALGPRAQVVPMDGFHLANAELARLGRAERKGAPDTFDAAGYAALLRRLRTP